MTLVVSHHKGDLGLPMGGPVLKPGVPTEVKRWDVIKGHVVVAAWLQAGVLSADDVPDFAAAAEPPADTIEGAGADDVPDFAAMDRDGIKAWLTAAGIEFDGRLGEASLREVAEDAYLASLETQGG